MTDGIGLPSLHLVLRLASRRGVDPSSLLARIGISPAAIAPDLRTPDTERRIQLAPFLRFLELLAEETRDRAVSLDVGTVAARPDAYGPLGLAILTADTAREAYLRASRYKRAWGGFAAFDLHEEPRRARLVFEHQRSTRLGAALAAEASVALTVAFAREMLEGDPGVTEVRFEHARPTSPEPFERAFAAPVRFETERTEIVLDASALDRRLPRVPVLIADYIVRQADAIVARMPSTSPTVQDVRRLLARELQGGDPSLPRVARSLSLSERTLRRRLTAEGASFEGLLGEVRREAAEIALDDPRLSVGEIAFLLGFSEPGSFARAFKRWTGKSPSEHRALRRARASG